MKYFQSAICLVALLFVTSLGAMAVVPMGERIRNAQSSAQDTQEQNTTPGESKPPEHSQNAQSQDPSKTDNSKQISDAGKNDKSQTQQAETDKPKSENLSAPSASDRPAERQTIEIPKSWKRLGKREIWIDIKAGEVIVAGVVCMQQGPLELFVCPLHTKEHESVIAVNALSSEVHASLIALGADPGRPVQWNPDYQPAQGPVVEVTVMWKDGEKIIKRRGQEMVREFETKKAMKHDWVFGGSQVYKDPTDGTNYYYGDAGELICLSNFSTATMDIPVQSTDANDMLMFEAFTENIPEVGTKVYVVMKPRIDPAKKKQTEK